MKHLFIILTIIVVIMGAYYKLWPIYLFGLMCGMIWCGKLGAEQGRALRENREQETSEQQTS